MSADPALVAAWLTARSLARALPPPIRDAGGLRVDTATETELSRWIFGAPSDAIRALTAKLSAPNYAVKLAASRDVLADHIAPGWHVESEHCMMVVDRAEPHALRLPESYQWLERSDGPVTHLRILASDGQLAASGYAAQCDGVFIYDRIVTVPGHRRRGLGAALMARLGMAKRAADAFEIQTASDAGKALYLTLGWRVYVPWSTALFTGATTETAPH